MEFGILGPLLIKDAAGARTVPAPKQRILLAALLVRAGQPVTAERLAEIVWDGRPPRSASSTLRNYVMRLRQVLGEAGERIETRDGGYLLRAAPAEVDLHRFAELRDRGLAALRADAVPDAAALLRDALALWRGPALADVPSDALHREEAERLAEVRLDALELRLAAELRLGRHTAALAELRELTTAHPERERFWAQLMTALELDGRPWEALTAYRRVRAALADELGVEPGPELQEAHHRILSGQDTPVMLNQLPPQLPDFTGRAVELRRLTEQLAAPQPHGAPQVAVLTGGPGIGKSALALRAGYLVGSCFPDGTLYAELGGATGISAVLGTLLGSLGLPPSAIPAGTAARTALYRSVLADRRVLVVLDDAQSGAQVGPLLPTGPGSAALVTTRDRMADLPGAQVVQLEPLGLPESRQLLARLIGPERVAREPLAATALVERCDGVPLALRICAARLAARPCWQLAQLAERLADQVLEELRIGRLDLWAGYTASFRRLDPAAARAFRALAERGSEALVRCRPDPVLERLVDAHLLTSPAPGHYRVRPLARAFGRSLRQALRVPPQVRLNP
ncbi:AfsR family transcriptional regulator [Kitasatospora acidiphila]|uniref:AfsR family transcriptional regulator n=1 Tax=Kitasatospora acidiphila TaxID=2567942 RepID=A0A540W0D0_9ACTN|nr:AfsR/SARP family transcriptional regulator [Kitasatospora acidiphila]TQF02482.1 AfsR family transcriptional regulator [Kitasatospora acidiphila]